MTEQVARQRKRMMIFRGEDAYEVGPDIMPTEGVDDGTAAALAGLAEAGAVEGIGERTRMVFSEAGEDGMSLVLAWFKSGYVLPFHSHDSDCLYYVIGGELRMGSHTLRKGDGMFIPADHAYGYEAGPDGVEVLEFRNATRFNFKFGKNSTSRWEAIANTFGDRAEIWASESVPPSGS